MNKFLSLLLLVLVLPLIQVQANSHITEEGAKSLAQVNYFSTTQIVCPLNSTSFPATIDVPIKVTGFNNISSTQGTISWDTSVIKFGYISSYGTSPLFSSAIFSPNPAGYLTFNWSSLVHGGVTVNDSSFFCTIRFTINGTFGKTSTIFLTNNPVSFKTMDSASNVIPSYLTNGSVILTNGSSVNISSPTSFCQGDSALLSSSIGTSYQWYYNGSPILYANNQIYNAYNTGTYSVLTTLSNGCNTYSNNINITANAAPPMPVISTNAATTTCSGGYIILTSSSGNTYQWYLNGNAISGGNSQSYTASTSGRYTVITKNTTGCSSPVSSAIQVTFNTLPPTPVITSKNVTTFCSNSYDTLICSSGTGYQWYLNGNPISGANNQSLVVNSSGNYSVTTSNNSCVSLSSATVAISVTSIIQPVVNTSGTTNLCPGNTVVLTSNSSYNFYQWYFNGNPINGANNPSITVSAAGSYTLQAGFAGGCTLISSPVVITNISVITPVINASGSTSLCTGGSVNITCSNNGYSSYQWYINGSAISNATNQTFTASSSGLYTVQVTTTSGCSSSTTAGINVVVNPVPSTPTITTIGSVNLCAGSSLTLLSSSSNNYQWYNNGTLINNAVSQSNIVTTAGSYTVSAINSYGCSAISQPVVVNVIPKTTPIISATGNISFCQGGSVQLNANSGYVTYQWYLNNILITNAKSAGYLVNVAGSYTVTGTTVDGCTSNMSAADNVTIYNKPTTPVISTNSATTICAGNSITLYSSVEYTYSWYLNGSLLNTTSNPSINVSSAGTYTVVTTNANGCNSAISNGININVNTPVVPSIITTGNTTICNGDSTILSTTSIGNTYQWYFNGVSLPNTNTQSIYANGNGNYTVSVTYPSGCSATSTATSITVYNSPTPIISANNTVLCPGSSQSIFATAGFNSYQWYKGGIPISGATQSTYTTNSTGSFTVVGTNTFGCNSIPSQSIIITAGSTPITPVISSTGSTSLCPGGSVILTSTNNNYNNYQWYLNGNSIPNTSQSITVNSAGSYSVMASNLNGCNSAKSNVISVSIYPAAATPVIISSTGTDSICPGNSLTLSTSLQSSYQWYLNGNPINNETGQYYIATATGNYSVNITNWVGCTATSLPTTIIVVPKTTPIITASGNTAFCKGGNVQLSTSGYTSYQWYNNGKAISGGTNSSILTDSAGNYTVIGTSSLGCASYTATPVNVTVYSLPTASVISTTTSTICNGYSTAITATPATAYTWYLNNNILTTTNNAIYNATLAGSYSVIITDQNGCMSAAASNSININVITPPVPTISVSGNTSICNGDSVLFTSSAGKYYQWYFNGIKINNSTSQNIYATANGNYTVAVTYSTGCTANSAAANLTVYTIPTPVINYKSLIICQGSNLTLSTTPGLAYYQWYLNGNQINGANSATYYTSLAGNYNVITFNSIGCNSPLSNTVQLTSTSIPTAPIITASKKNFCLGDTVYLTSSTGNTYQWYYNGSVLNGATNSTLATTNAGNYSIVVTNSAGCSSPNAVTTTIAQYPYTTPVIAYNGSTNICSGNSVLLSANTGYAYQWYINSTAIINGNTNSYTATTTGLYSIKITDTYGCSLYSSPIAISVETVPPPGISVVGNNTICNGDSTILVASSGYINYQWYLNGNAINLANNQSITIKSTGNYTVTGTAVSGCVSVASTPVNITVSGVPNQPIITAPTNGLCNGGSIILNSNVSASNYQWYLNGNPVIGANSSTFTAYGSGSYSMIAINSAGCSSQASNNYVVTNYSTTPVITTTGNTVFCNGSSALLSATSGIAYQWYINGNIITGATNQNYYAGNAGTYTVGVTNTSNCTSISSGITITVNTVSTPLLNTTANVVCKGNSATLTASSGYAYYQWYINGVVVPGITSMTYTATTTGNYTVTGTTAAGCTSPASLPVSLMVSSGPVNPSISSNGSSNICSGSSIILFSTKAFAYQWYLNGTPIAGAITQNYATSLAGTYAIVETDSFGCKSNLTSGLTVANLPTPSAPVITPLGNTTICQNNSMTLTTTAATSYQWYLNGFAISGANSINYIAKTSGNYTVQVSNNNNCSATSPTPVTVIVLPTSKPTVTLTGWTSFCASGSATLTANTDSGYTQYQWYKNAVVIPGATGKTFRVDSTGSYYVVASMPLGCISVPSAATAFSVYPMPAVPAISPAGKTAICKNSTLTLTGPVAAGYVWYKNGTAITGAVSPTLTISDTGTYSLQVYNSGGCSNKSVVNTVVGIDSNNVTVGSITKTSFCKGDSVLLTAATGYTYQWYNSTTAITGAASKNYTVKQTGAYSVYAVDSNNCPSVSGSTTVTVISSQAPTVITNGPNTYCSGNNKTTLTGAPGLSYYQWYKNDTAISGASTANYTPLTSGIYTLVAYNVGDCPSLTSAATGITIVPTPAKPVATSNGITQLCNGKSILFVSSAGSSYQWYRNGVALSGASYQSFNATTPGYYSVQNISNGCSSALSDSIVIVKVVNAGFSVNTISQPLCSNNFVFTSSYPYATNKYYWSFGDGLAASTLNTSHIYAKEGSYNIKQIVTSSDNSCVDSISQTITVTKCTADGISEPDSVNIYPNPNNGIFKVKFLSIVQRNAKVAVIGASTGIIFMIKDIQAIEGRNTINIDMTAPVFKPGVYIIRIIGDNISYTPQRFVLIK